MPQNSTSKLTRGATPLSPPHQVIVFGDACIMDAPVEDWPVCDCLVAFYSTGFPSDKAEAYVKLRRPYALNNLEMQDVLHDRRRVRKRKAEV